MNGFKKEERYTENKVLFAHPFVKKSNNKATKQIIENVKTTELFFILLYVFHKLVEPKK